MTRTLILTPIMRLPVILAVFATSFLVVSRKLSIFQNQDFEILESALPSILRRHVRIFQNLLVWKLLGCSRSYGLNAGKQP